MTLAILSYNPVVLNKTHMAMMDVMTEILKRDSDNKFKDPHRNKD
jgi:hypothetical protein